MSKSEVPSSVRKEPRYLKEWTCLHTQILFPHLRKFFIVTHCCEVIKHQLEKSPNRYNLVIGEIKPHKYFIVQVITPNKIRILFTNKMETINQKRNKNCKFLKNPVLIIYVCWKWIVPSTCLSFLTHYSFPALPPILSGLRTDLKEFWRKLRAPVSSSCQECQEESSTRKIFLTGRERKSGDDFLFNPVIYFSRPSCLCTRGNLFFSLSSHSKRFAG